MTGRRPPGSSRPKQLFLKIEAAERRSESVRTDPAGCFCSTCLIILTRYVILKDIICGFGLGGGVFGSFLARSSDFLEASLTVRLSGIQPRNNLAHKTPENMTVLLKKN